MRQGFCGPTPHNEILHLTARTTVAGRDYPRWGCGALARRTTLQLCLNRLVTEIDKNSGNCSTDGLFVRRVRARVEGAASGGAVLPVGPSNLVTVDRMWVPSDRQGG